MRKRMTMVLCLILAVALVLSGCGLLEDLGTYLDRLGTAVSGNGVVAYDSMEYTRPDMTAIEQRILKSCGIARTSSDLDEVLDAIYAYYELYDDFYTNMSLSYIKYSGDLRDTYWEGEYNYCSEHYPTVDAGLEELYYALAESPIRDKLEGERYFGADFFDAYEGESIWDDTFLAMLEEESQLQNRYYELMGQSEDVYSDEFLGAYGDELAQLLVDLVAHRQQLAAYMGYGSYAQFAYDFYHYRDYTPAQALAYTETIRQELVELYRAVNGSDVWDIANESCSEAQMMDYVESCAKAMGGQVADAFEMMVDAGLYDVSYGEYKLNSSFEVFLDSYMEPFVFVNPTGGAYDKLTLAHEFGHFAHDYVCYGTYASTDVAEVLSQGMEYLSLLYCEDTEELEALKLADSLCVYVEQAAYAAFEHRLYELTGDALTVENVRALYEQVGMEFGFDSWDWDRRDFVLMTHYYTQPMYIISYVVSNDAAFQLYQLEQAEAGAGLSKYEQMLQSEESWFGTFVEDMGLESPFTTERVQSVRDTMEQILG